MGVVWSIEKHWESLGGELNRSTCRLGADSVDPRSHVLYGGQGWTNLFAAATSDKSLTQHFVQIL